MAADAHPIPVKLGEKPVFYGKAIAPAGSTHQVSGTSTVTLYDKDGAVAGGLNATAVTGQETGAQLELLAWYLFDPTTLTVPEGVYHLVFTIVATGSDGIVRTFKPAIFILVEAASA